MTGNFLRPTITVEIAFPSSSGSSWLIFDDATTGKFDTGQFGAGPDSASAWTDISQYVQSISTRRGRNRQLETFNTGQASFVLDNTDRRFDPTNLSGPYVLAGVSSIRPMLGIRVVATWNGTDYPLFRGYVDDWQIEWDDPALSYVRVSASDAFKVLAAYDPLASADVGGGELSGARINRILDNTGFPTADRLIDTGLVTMQSTNLAQNSLSEAKLTADSEMGDLFVDGSGRIVFRDRTSRYTRSTSKTSQATYGDGATEYNYETAVAPFNDELVKNKISVSNVGGTVATREDTSSESKYLTKTYQRLDLVFSDEAYSTANADLWLMRYKDADLRFDAVTFYPDAYDAGALWPEVLGRDIGDRVTVNKSSIPGGGSAISRACFIEGVSHDIPQPNGAWTTTFQLSDATTFFGLIFDDSVYGKFDATVAVFG